jgi:hypothetical protein
MTNCLTGNKKLRWWLMGALVFASLVGGADSQALAFPAVVNPGLFTVWAEGHTSNNPSIVFADGTSLTNEALVAPSPSTTILTLTGGGDANSLRAQMAVSSTSILGGIGFFDVSMFDTYTLIGAPGTVPITAKFHLVGDITRTSLFANFQVRAQIGTWTTNPVTIDDRVGPFGGDFSPADATYTQTLSTAAPSSFNVDIMATYTQDVTVGTPFSLAYQIQLFSSSLNGTFDFLNTGAVGFTVPEGYSITSVGGFGAPVPLPGSVVLMGSGLLGLVGVVRWRRRS